MKDTVAILVAFFLIADLFFRLLRFSYKEDLTSIRDPPPLYENPEFYYFVPPGTKVSNPR